MLVTDVFCFCMFWIDCSTVFKTYFVAEHVEVSDFQISANMIAKYDGIRNGDIVPS